MLGRLGRGVQLRIQSTLQFLQTPIALQPLELSSSFDQSGGAPGGEEGGDSLCTWRWKVCSHFW